MSGWADVVTTVLVSLGAVFCVIGGLGLLRFPDFYVRVHAAGITDTLGATLVLVGLMFQSGFGQVTVKLVMVLLFLLATSPTATHALVKAAYGHGVRLPLPIPERALEPGEDPYAVEDGSLAGEGAREES